MRWPVTRFSSPRARGGWRAGADWFGVVAIPLTLAVVLWYVGHVIR